MPATLGAALTFGPAGCGAGERDARPVTGGTSADSACARDVGDLAYSLDGGGGHHVAGGSLLLTDS